MKHELKAIINASADGFIKAINTAWNNVKSFAKNTKDKVGSLSSAFKSTDKAIKDTGKSAQAADQSFKRLFRRKLRCDLGLPYFTSYNISHGIRSP